ncbi:MAG: malonate decarboxylase holo-ACP synthase [Inquilinus limosus]|uniref:Malonate decarboxylase holo-ACP synthase n=1 Tax=Inquilinus limosus TaxID=171674 RepID=A0A952FKH4_9PROT|nr:malonate decarboxylase holo-ACP synthase [Inquilinus limosus]
MSGEGIDTLPLPLLPSLRGGEADEAIRGPVRAAPGLLRCARNDGIENLDRVSLARPFQPHDLLRIDQSAVAELTRDRPGWATASLAAVPWVVVRRAMACDGLLPVGLRGHGRSERCAAWLPPAAVVECRTPEDLAAARAWRRSGIPALAALDAVAALLAGWSWGPAGSVGFELATGHPTAHPESDLDIVLRAPCRMRPDEADHLLAALAPLPVRVDVAVEAPLGACSLAEIAAGGVIVVKTPTGPRLVRDPWAEPAAA